MGSINCCNHRYDTDFQGASNKKDLLYFYEKDLSQARSTIKDIEKTPDNIQGNLKLRFLKIFVLKVEDLKQKINRKPFKDIEVLKDLSFKLFATLDEKNEEQFKLLYIEITNYVNNNLSN